MGPTAMRRYSALPKVPAFLEPHYSTVYCHI